MFSTEPEINFSQSFLLYKLIKFYTQLFPSPNQKQFLLLEKLKSGHCNGFTILVLYALWLEMQPRNLDKHGNKILRDDYTWFVHTVTKLNFWNENIYSLPDEAKEDFTRLLSHIEYFQYIFDYLSSGQGELEQFVSDTQDRKPICEYKIAGCFTGKNLLQKIDVQQKVEQTLFEYDKRTTFVLESIIPNNRIALITSNNHDTGILRWREFWFYYDSNYLFGVRSYTSEYEIKNLIEDLFQANLFHSNIPSPLGFRIFSFDKTNVLYPDVKAILESLNIPNSNSYPGYAENFTSLHINAFIGCKEGCEFFINNHADVNALTSGSATPLQVSVINGNLEVFNLLIDSGANLYSIDDRGFTLMHEVIIVNQIEMLKQLIQKGLDVNAQTSKGYTPLMIAVMKERVHCVLELLEHGADPNMIAQNENTAIYFAVMHDHLEILNILIKYKARINIDFKQVLSPLCLAITLNHREIFHRLLENGANVNAQANATAGPLHIAVENNRVDMVTELISAGADINAKNSKGKTALFIATEKKLTELMSLLIKAHADVNLSDADGFTPLHLAVLFDHTEGVQLLLKNKADPLAKTARSLTPKDLVLNVEIEKILETAEEKYKHPNSLTASSGLFQKRFAAISEAQNDNHFGNPQKKKKS